MRYFFLFILLIFPFMACTQDNDNKDENLIFSKMHPTRKFLKKIIMRMRRQLLEMGLRMAKA